MNIGRDAGFSAHWLLMLPEVANDCHMKVVRAQVDNVAYRFRDQRMTALLVQRLQPWENPMLQDWKSMYVSDRLGACQFAETMWDEDGRMFPGVLGKL